MEKTTTISHTTSAGKDVKIIITRIQGTEQARHWDDGYEFFSDEYKDTYEITVEYDGKTHMFCHIQYDSKAPGGRYLTLMGRQALCLPEDKWAILDKAIKEQITEEISPSDKSDIEEAKEALASGRIMPKAELEKKRKEYDATFNEDGDGYNPYFYYLSSEWVDSIKTKFPDYFKD